MASDWEEVKRLAADFQRAQLSSTTQKLSERNCIEIVKKLIEMKLINVIFTSDGKEYLTPQRLLKEIRDELIVQGGRVNLVDLAQSIGVDFSHVEAKAVEYARTDPDVRIVLGQLVSSQYLDGICEEINEKLEEAGQISIGDITKTYDLPSDFLIEVVYERLGTIIKAQPDANDSRIFLTTTYIEQNRGKIQGILSAITRPVQVANLLNNFKIPDNLFYSVADELIKSGRIRGTLTGGRTDKALYVPDIYTEGQNEWIDSFYQQNGYLEYDALSRLGIQDPKNYIKKRFKDQRMTFLSSCCVGKPIFDLLESAVEEALNSGHLVDVKPVLPSVFSSDDYREILRKVMSSIPRTSKIHRIYCDSIVVSEDVVQACLSSFDALMNAKAQEDVAQKPHLFMPQQSAAKVSQPAKEEISSKSGKQTKKEERKKKGGKPGGGTQGRETKTKAVKKKYMVGKGDDSASDDEASSSAVKESCAIEQLEFIAADAIKDHLQRNMPILSDFPEELLYEMAENFEKPLRKRYQNTAKSIFESMVSSSSTSRKKQYAEFQEKLGGLLSHIAVFEKSTKLFSEDVATQLNKHLLKTLCTDVVNMIVSYLSQEHGVGTAELSSDASTELRQKVIEKLPEEFKQDLKKANSSLHSKTLEDFNSSIEAILSQGICDSVSQKVDKKKERQLLSCHRQSLLSQLSEASDPALCLHLAVLIIFQSQTKNALHASGKFVPHIISYLQKQIPLESYQQLALYQEYVIKSLTSDDSEEQEKARTFLLEMMPKIKETAVTFKKSSVSEGEAQ